MSFSSVVDVGLTCCSSYLTTSAAPLISSPGKCFRFYSVSCDFIFVVVLLAYAVGSEFSRYFVIFQDYLLKVIFQVIYCYLLQSHFKKRTNPVLFHGMYIAIPSNLLLCNILQFPSLLFHVK